MPTTIQFKIKIEQPINARTYRNGYLPPKEVKGNLSVFMLNKVNSHVKRHFKPDNFTVRVTDECFDDENRSILKILDEIQKSTWTNWNKYPVPPSSIETSEFIVELRYTKDIDPRIFIIKDSYSRFLNDYNEDNKGFRQCYSIVKMEKDK
jgi:hypothetical protein